METERLFFRRWTEADAEDLYEFAKDPDVGPRCGWRQHGDVEESRRIIKDVLSAPEAYAICLKPSDRAIGTVELRLNNRSDLTDGDDECELGYWIGKPYWGQGLMPEAAKRMIEHAFIDLGMNKVWCAYYDGNEQSKKVQQKCGFNFVRTTQDVYVAAFDEYRVGHVNCLTKEEWQKIR